MKNGEDNCGGHYLKLNDEIWAFEYNPEDGYRSSCDEYQISNKDIRLKNVTFNFEDYPIEVYLENWTCANGAGSFRGIKLYDSNDPSERKEIGVFGTSNIDDWYPSCCMNIDIPRINELYFYELVSK